MIPRLSAHRQTSVDRDSRLSLVGEYLTTAAPRPDSKDEALLDLTRRLADRFDELERLVDADGVRRIAKDGRVQLHPALAEARQRATTLAQVLAHITVQPVMPADPRKQAAAQARWRRHNASKAARAAGSSA